MKEYEVIYYKRKNKVHKSKGVSKSDGILIVRPDERTVVLRTAQRDEDEEENGCSDNEASDAGWKRDKKKLKRQKTRTTSSGDGTLFCGQICAATKENLMEDQIIALGGYEVQVVGITGTSGVPEGSTRNNQQQRSSNISRSGAMKTNEIHPPVRRKQGSVLSRKRKSILPLPASKKEDTLPCTSRPRLLRQSESIDDVRSQATSHAVVKPKSASGRSGSVASAHNEPNVVLPHIPLTASIRSSLRTHQISGVEFLWSCLMGNLRGGT